MENDDDQTTGLDRMSDVQAGEDTQPLAGKLFLAPTGTGKTYALRHSNVHVHNVIDGDDLLRDNCIKNQHRFWYPTFRDEWRDERERIIACFNKHLELGITIFHSANPMLCPCDAVVLIPEDDRWLQLEVRRRHGEWSPNRSDFEIEQKAFDLATRIYDIEVFDNMMTALFSVIFSHERQSNHTEYDIDVDMEDAPALEDVQPTLWDSWPSGQPNSDDINVDMEDAYSMNDLSYSRDEEL